LEPGGTPPDNDEIVLSLNTFKYWFKNSKSPTKKNT